jgi:predicted alpha/beta superfamily hydrolase
MMKTSVIVAVVGTALLLGSPTIAQQTRSDPITRASTDVINSSAVIVPRATQYDITSRINGATYRIMVSSPPNADLSVANPVLYVLDGNVYFATATEAMWRQSRFLVAPAITVGIGYPTEDEFAQRRLFDLTPYAAQEPEVGERSGGGVAFLRVIEEEVKPFLMSKYKIDPTKQIFWGQSVGGLTVLRALLRTPEAFSDYIMSSPSIWWNKREVLADEESFSNRAKAGELHVRVLVTSAEDEQYRGDDPTLLNTPEALQRMVDNASELAARLATLDPQNVQVVRTIFPGEVHGTVGAVSLNRALRFALRRN